MNGLLGLRAQGNQVAAVAARMRLGHIPAGSTDAVAYSINGTRSQLTATLHIALGDRSFLHRKHVSCNQGLQGMHVNEQKDAANALQLPGVPHGWLLLALAACSLRDRCWVAAC